MRACVCVCSTVFALGTAAIAEACSYRSAIRTARGVVQDLGEQVAKTSGGLTELARCSEAHSERDGRTVIAKKFGLALPIEFSNLPRAPGVSYAGELVMLKLRSWLSFILSLNVTHLLCGLHRPDPARERNILGCFWERFRKVKPRHPMWAYVDSGQLDCTRAFPLVLHGDEGRGRKRQPFLVISWSSILGFGTESANEARKSKPYNVMRLNYTLSTHLTRFVTATLPKMARDSEALSDILQAIATDANQMLQPGLCNSAGERFFAVCVNSVGDWQWLAKAGSFLRSYANVNKRPMTEKSVPKGICHLCLADQRGVPWENYRVYDIQNGVLPAWHPTLYTVDPWEMPSPLSSIPCTPGEEPSFYAYDLFHSYHLGVGKSFAAGCLALASELMASSNLDGRLEELTELYLTWAGENKVPTFLSYFSKANLGWPDLKSFPNGQWNKGHVTTTVLDFFLSWAQKQDLTGHELLRLSMDACVEITQCLRGLYRSDVWILQKDAIRISNHGMKFMNLYRILAYKAFSCGRALFPHMPKGHAMDHIFFDLHASAISNKYSLNCLIWSVQLFEDYIGKCSKISRRTSPQQVVKRVLQRCLQASYRYWYEAGFIKD